MTKDGKWRSGSLGYCTKTDCINRDKLCDSCHGLPPSEYVKKKCSNCKHPDGGVCQHAGEISDNYVCEHWEEADGR